MSEHELWNELGNLYFMSGAYNQAANAYQRSIQTDSDFGRPYSNLALTYVQQGKYDEAIELYRRSIELLVDDKEKAISLNRLGNVYRHLKDYSNAVIAFQRADDLDPRSADDFPPYTPPRSEVQQAPSSVLDQPVAAVAEPVAEDVVYQPEALLPDEPVTVVVDEPGSPISDDPVPASAPDPLSEDIVYQPEAVMPDETVAAIRDEPVAETRAEAIAESSIEPITAIRNEQLADTWDEPIEESSSDEPILLGPDERLNARLDFLVTEALDQAAMAVADQQPTEPKEPEIKPVLEWWDVEEPRGDMPTQVQVSAPEPAEDPATSWTPADLSGFQQDVSQMPDIGSLTTWHETGLEDDFELWPPLDPEPDIDAPDPDSENISTWLPIPEESPFNLEEIRTPPFVDELEAETEAFSDWDDLSSYHVSDSRSFAPIMPTSAEPAERADTAADKQASWEAREVDVDVQERPVADFTLMTEEHASQPDAEPVLRHAQPGPVLTPAVEELPAPAISEPDRDEEEMREIEMGIARFRRVVQINPHNAHAWDALGTLYKSAGLYKDAILAYQQAISNDPSKSLYYHHLGLVYACEGRDEDAISAFQRVIEIDPEYSLAHATLGGYYRKMGLEELAQKHIGKAMKNIFDSENEYNRACLEAICGNADQAIKLLDVALKNKQTYVDWILRDPDLDFIRQDPRFKQLISRYTR